MGLLANTTKNATGGRLHSPANWVYSNGDACPSGYAMHPRRSITRTLQKIQQRHGSVVMAYIDNIVIATETIEDHIMRIKEVFECLREAGFKMRAEMCDFMRTETKYLGRIVSTDGIKPDPEAVAKIQEWLPPETKKNFKAF